MAVGLKTEREYEAADDCRTMMHAEEIRKDPKRLKGARKHAQRQMKAMRTIAGKGR